MAIGGARRLCFRRLRHRGNQSLNPELRGLDPTSGRVNWCFAMLWRGNGGRKVDGRRFKDDGRVGNGSAQGAIWKKRKASR